MIYLELFYTFFTIGLFTFGGGYAMLPLIQQKVVENGWLTLEEIVDFVAVSESTPGPFAVNIATYVGSETGGLLGSLCATLGVVLPSFLVILIVAKCYIRFKQSKLVSGAMFSLRATVVGLMAAALFGMLPTVFFHEMSISWKNVLTSEFLCSLGIFGVMVVPAIKKVSPILLIIASAVCGIACGYIFGWA
ncbi:MAG: chromate transporter [Ruminococcaceae bacterium]|nr:chromate transporter [Oscillospiraceae bacterium]